MDSKRFFQIMGACRISCCLLMVPSLLLGLVLKSHSAHLEFLSGKTSIEVSAGGYVSVPSAWDESGPQFISDSFYFHRGPMHTFDYSLLYANGVELYSEYGHASAGTSIKFNLIYGSYGLHYEGTSFSGTYINFPDCTATSYNNINLSIIEPFSYFIAPDIDEKFGDPLEDFYITEYRYVDELGGGFASIGPLIVRINGAVIASSPKIETDYAHSTISETYFYLIAAKIGDIISIDPFDGSFRTDHWNDAGPSPTAFLEHDISLSLPVSYPAGAVPIPGAVILYGSGLLILAIARLR